MKNITVLFEDDNFLVLNKPAGLPVQGGAGVGVSLDSLLAKAYKSRPFLVHRLDKDTSGVIVTAKTRESAAACSVFFASPAGLHKRYLALCAGIQDEKGIISETLLVKGRELTAKTSYRLLACANFPADADLPAAHSFSWPVSFLELQPATGRMHQIRRHLAQVNCPILGDDKYGNFTLNKRLRKSLGLKRLLLHAASICLPPSLVKGGIEINASLPDYFSAVLEKAGFSAGGDSKYRSR
jgi:23S rRNA pseudouridine955/2504/2580 synthase